MPGLLEGTPCLPQEEPVCLPSEASTRSSSFPVQTMTFIDQNSEGGKALQRVLQQQLKEYLGQDYNDDVLPLYIVVMLAHGTTQALVAENLEVRDAAHLHLAAVRFRQGRAEALLMSRRRFWETRRPPSLQTGASPRHPC